MKYKLLLTVLLLSALFTTGSAQTPDGAAIRKTLDGSTLLAADKRDLNAFAALFVNAPDLYCQISTPDKYEMVAYGWTT